MPHMKPLVPVAGIVALVAFVALSRDHGPVPDPEASTKLERFEGSLTHSDTTSDPVLSDLYVRAGRALEAGDSAKAKELYREAVSRYPNDPDGYRALGAVAFFEKDYDRARAEYARALEIKPDCGKAFYGLGCVAYKERRYAESRAYLEKALETIPRDGSCHRVLALSYDEERDARKALFHYERAVEYDPSLAKDEDVKTRLAALRKEAAK